MTMPNGDLSIGDAMASQDAAYDTCAMDPPFFIMTLAEARTTANVDPTFAEKVSANSCSVV